MTWVTKSKETICDKIIYNYYFNGEKFALKFPSERNIRCNIVATGCDQCMWAVGAVAGYGIE